MTSRPLFEWTLSAGAVVICTAVAWVLTPYLSTTDQAMLYFVGTVIVASRTGTWPSFLTVVLSITAFNFFFVPPQFTFAVYDARFVVTFAVMFIVAFAISRLTNQVRRKAEESRLREQETAALYEMSRDLLSQRDLDRLQDIAAEHIGRAMDGAVHFVLFDPHGGLVTPAAGLSGPQEEAVRWALTNRQPAGAAILNGPDADATYVPLIASRGIVGAVGVRWRKRRDTIALREMRFLEAFAQQAALAIERTELVDEAHDALHKVETERIRNTLLSSISHDFRTPLTAVAGAVSTLIENESVDPQNRRELLQTIQEEASRLNGMIRNVLDLTRIESGAITVRKEWQPLEEIIGAVLNRLGDRLGDRLLDVRLPPDLPLIPFDALLVEQVLANLLENVIKYAPQGLPIELSAVLGPGLVTVEVADRGPGLTPGAEEKIFDKFVRGRASGGGVGLGLAICRAIVNAHGGRIWAENRAGGGALFKFTLPVEGTPPQTKADDEAKASS